MEGGTRVPHTMLRPRGKTRQPAAHLGYKPPAVRYNGPRSPESPAHDFATRIRLTWCPP
jgi:hypothetical protein